MREHLETFLATVREERGRSLPRYIEQELRRYLRCGLLPWGFARVVCPTCRKEILVACSCKCRGACPSCSARRMCDSAAHLVEHVLPDVPVRQWVLTAPPEVRRGHRRNLRRASRRSRVRRCGSRERGARRRAARAPLGGECPGRAERSAHPPRHL
ncbi:transposase zinc-binding domain-containing protein [Sorangium sp. So ce1128]